MSVNIHKQARQFVITGCYSKAFEMYMKTFEKFPDSKVRVETEFRRLLTKFNEYLLTVNKIGDIFFNFERSIDCYPGNIYILNDIGRYLYKFGYLREACCHFQKALNSEVGYVSAEKNLNSVKNAMVERWHYRMLNDKIRNEAFRRALREVILPLKETILDLGTGTGLLAMYANEAMPMMITACDGSDIMIEIAGYVLEENRVEDIILVSKMSTTLNYRDIGGKRALIITELFDAGLLGEHILETLTHAWEYLMAPNARVLPFKAEFFIVGAKCDFLDLKYRLSKDALTLLNIPTSNVHVFISEPYDSEDVYLFKDLKYITEPKSLFTVHFSDIEDMREKLNSTVPYNVNIKAKETSDINVIIGWFDLYLSPNVAITTNPMDPDRANAWQQAVFYNFIPKVIQEDDSMPLQFTTFGGKVALIPDNPDHGYEVSAEMIRFLNDFDYIKLIKNSIGAICIYLCQIVDVSCLNLLDFSPFPVFGLMMLKRGAQSLTCFVKSPNEKEFILKVMRANKVPASKLNILNEDELTIESFGDSKFHVIYTNIIELSGDIDTKQKELLKQLRIANLSPGGLMLPNKVTLEGRLISSDWLEKNNQVSDQNTSNYKIARFINKYQVSQNFHIDISHLEYTAISEVATIAVCSEGMASDVVNVEIIDDGDANAVICWYKIQLIDNGDTVSTDRENSYIDSMAFLANPKVTMRRGDTGNILRCVDGDESFKLLVDVE